MKYKRLGDLLLAAGMITESDLEEALKIQKERKDRLGKVLIDEGYITETQLIDALCMQLGIDFIDLSKIVIEPEMVEQLPKTIAKKYGVVPVKLIKDTLYLAMKDPLNFMAIEEVKGATKTKVVPMISTENAVDRAISSLYGN